MPILIPGAQNVQVTFDSDPRNARSESVLVANPLAPSHMVGASKRFTDPAEYLFSLATYVTPDGGASWSETPAPALLPGWTGISDPAVAWDNVGNAYLAGLAFQPGPPQTGDGDAALNVAVVGIALYKSPDGGLNWGPPDLIHASLGDDKQAAAGDAHAASPFFGHVYVAWDDSKNVTTGDTLRFARTTDGGVTWRGVGADPNPGTALADDSFAPAITVAPDGTVYVVWSNGETSATQVKFVKSTDGGETFSAPAVAVGGITPLAPPSLAAPDGSPELPGGTFRVLTLAAACAGTGGQVLVAWADHREGVSRIYCRRSPDAGASWEGPTSGRPLLADTSEIGPGRHDFHPQLASSPDGAIGCAFYEFGPLPGVTPPTPVINVLFALSLDGGLSFPNRETVTSIPWNPAVDAPLAAGASHTTFIGEYFGLGVNGLTFSPFWTDTRTGIQEIWTARVSVDLCGDLEDEIQGLSDAIEAAEEDWNEGGAEDPVPHTPAVTARHDAEMGKLFQQYQKANRALEACQKANPQP